MVEFQHPTIGKRSVVVLTVIALLAAMYGFVMRVSPLVFVLLVLVVAAAVYVFQGLFG